ncbi:MAG: hypothetical protein ACYTE6_06175 [Planctomycetota bacterium]
MPRIGPGRLPIVLTLLATAPAPAQQTSVDLEPVDQAIEDVSVLSTSLRRVEPGLLQPNDFSRVYRVHGRRDLFMRQQGGLYAVFPASVYGSTKEGKLQALIPHDTMFHIGPPPLLNSEPPPAAPRPGGLVQGRIDLKIDPHREPAAPTAGLGTRSTGQASSRITLPAIVSDEAYRQRRVRSLLRRAAAGATASPRPGGTRCVESIHAARGRSSSSSK